MNLTAWHPRYLQQDRHRSLLALLLQKDAKGILNYWPFLCRLPPYSGSAMTRQRMEEICWKGKALNPVSQQDSTCCHLQAPRALCVWGVGSKSCDAQRPLTKGHGGFNVFSHIYICSSRSQSHPEPLFRHELFVFMFLHVSYFFSILVPDFLKHQNISNRCGSSYCFDDLGGYHLTICRPGGWVYWGPCSCLENFAQRVCAEYTDDALTVHCNLVAMSAVSCAPQRSNGSLRSSVSVLGCTSHFRTKHDKATSRTWKILEYFMEWWLLIDVAVTHVWHV